VALSRIRRVVRLYVQVALAARVQLGQLARHQRRDRRDLLRGQSPRRQPQLAQVRAVDVGHLQVEIPLGFFGLGEAIEAPIGLGDAAGPEQHQTRRIRQRPQKRRGLAHQDGRRLRWIPPRAGSVMAESAPRSRRREFFTRTPSVLLGPTRVHEGAARRPRSGPLPLESQAQ
jgi:hypothetical protein